jgi:transposase
MMREILSTEEAAMLIKGRQVLRARGLKLDADVKTICEAAGISRKTGYKWTNQFGPEAQERENELRGELAQLQAEKEELEKRLDDISFENEGRKLAWKLHGVDELIRSKKNTSRLSRKEKR